MFHREKNHIKVRKKYTLNNRKKVHFDNIYEEGDKRNRFNIAIIRHLFCDI